MEVKTCIKCGAVRFVRRQYLRSCLLSYNLPTSTLFARQLETYTTSLLFSLGILRNSTSNCVKTPSAINQSFRLDKKLHHVKIPAAEGICKPASQSPTPVGEEAVLFHSAPTAKGLYSPPDHGYLK